MKLTQAYIRKLVMEELLNEQASSTQKNLAQQIKQSAKSSPFIKMMNDVSAQNQLFVLQQFLKNITIKNPKTFYADLSNMALKLEDSKTKTQPATTKGPAKQNEQ